MQLQLPVTDATLWLNLFPVLLFLLLLAVFPGLLLSSVSLSRLFQLRSLFPAHQLF